jgi:Sulfotransferase family
MTTANRAVPADLRASSERMAHASPVFIVGHTRSGTSLLYRTLQSHTAFRPTSMDLHETQIFHRLPTASAWGIRPPRQLLAFMLKNREHYEAFLQETRWLRMGTVATAAAAVPLRGDLPLPVWRAHGLHLIVRSYLAHAWSARGCERLVEKSPRNVPHVPKLLAVSPRARMVFLCRHPVDVYSSYLKRARNDPAASWANISQGKFVRRYRSAVLGATARAAVAGSPLLVLKYEEFTSDPVAQFARVCEFIGERVERAAVEELPPPGGSERTPAKARPLDGAIVANTKRWQDVVGVDEARQVEDQLADVMDRVGYARYT